VPDPDPYARSVQKLGPDHPLDREEFFTIRCMDPAFGHGSTSNAICSGLVLVGLSTHAGAIQRGSCARCGNRPAKRRVTGALR